MVVGDRTYYAGSAPLVHAQREAYIHIHICIEAILYVECTLLHFASTTSNAIAVKAIGEGKLHRVAYAGVQV